MGKKHISESLYYFLKDNNLPDVITLLQYREDSKDYFDFSISDGSKISYYSGDRIPKDESLLWDTEYRKNNAYHTKIGKLISGRINNETIQKISALLYTRKAESGIKLSVTNDIMKYYHEKNYSEKYNHGTLYNSCMRYSECQDYISFYESLGESVVQLIIASEDNNKTIVGRALLWHNVIKKDCPIPITYMDRIYSANDNIKQLFLNYAQEKNILTRDENASRLQIENINIDYDAPLPYMDTFQYYTGDSLNTYSGDYNLSSTSGDSLNDIGGKTCCECGDSYHEDEIYYSESLGDYLCSNCGIYIEGLEDFIPMNQAIEINGKYYHKQSDEIIYSEYESDYILLDDSIYCEYEDTYISNESEYKYSEYHDKYFTIECKDVIFSEHHKDWLLKDESDIVFSEFHQDYLIKSESDIVFSSFHNDYLIESHDDVLYIESEKDYFLINDSVIFQDESGEWKHKQSFFPEILVS